MSAGTEAVRRYLSALGGSDLDAMMACFTADAVVVSPVYGTVSARSFLATLHNDTIRAEVVLLTIYLAEDRTDRVIAHFAYRWERRSAPMLDTHVLDFFDLTSEAQIKRLRILLDAGGKSAS